MKKALIPALLAVALCVPATAARPINWRIDRQFKRLDINNDNVLSQTEFLATVSRRAPVVLALHRFAAADANQDGSIDLTEFRASRGGRAGGKLTRVRSFVLADRNGDFMLDHDEFADTVPQRIAWKGVLRAFGKRDRNKDGLLTPREFGIRKFPL